MLVLSRKPGEKVLIANDITITVLSVQGNRIRLGIEAPSDYRVLRSELAEWGSHETKAVRPAPPVPAITASAADVEMAWAI